jgi:putative peptidoglycan lipid II flippase
MRFLRGRTMSLRVLFQMMTVGAFTGLVKIAGAAKVIFTARAFGMGDDLDAYLIAYLLPSFVCDILAGSLTSALVPTFIEVREKQGRQAADRLYQSVLAIGVGLLAIASVVIALIAPWALHALASSFNPAKLSLTCSLTWMMLPIMPLSAFIIAWRSVLNTEGRFALPAALPAATPLATIACLLAFRARCGVYSLAFGTVAGTILEAALLAVFVFRCGFPVLPRWWGRGAAFDQVLAQYGPVVAGVLLIGGAPLIDQAIAATLAPGSIAALNYGTRFTIVMLAIGPTAVSTAILPHFSRLTVLEDWTQIRHNLRTYGAIILSVSIPVVVLLIAISTPLVRLFFERGQFNGADTQVVASVQRFSLLQIPSSMVMALLLRLVSSMKANQLLLRAAAFGAVLNLALDLALTRPMGISGIALSTAIVELASLLYVLRLVRTHLPASFQAAPTAAALEPGAQ